MNPDHDQEPMWLRIICNSMFCESGRRRDHVLIALGMGLVGTVLLCGLYRWGWMAPGYFRGITAWFVVAIFYAKVVNLYECGGPIASGAMGIGVILWMEALIR